MTNIVVSVVDGEVVGVHGLSPEDRVLVTYEDEVEDIDREFVICGTPVDISEAEIIPDDDLVSRVFAKFDSKKNS